VDVRIRRNETNLGASESRNRGMQESAADWIHFLDDDIVPQSNLLLRVEQAIRDSPNAAGFVGRSNFPRSDTIFTTAVRLAGVVFFWDIATNLDLANDVPWGVTANLVVHRKIDLKDDIFFDTSFPKTGGGEDIEFCRRKREFSIQQLGGKGFIARPDIVVSHPWWNNGTRSYRRFYMWAYGDGALVKRFPDLTYGDLPNSAELFLVWVLGFGMAVACGNKALSIWFLKAILLTVTANVVHDCYRHIWKHPDRYVNMPPSLRRVAWLVAVIESSLIRMASEMGRLHGIIARGEVQLFGKRFDWFTGRLPTAATEERMNNFGRLSLLFVLLAAST